VEAEDWGAAEAVPPAERRIPDTDLGSQGGETAESSPEAVGCANRDPHGVWGPNVDDHGKIVNGNIEISAP